MDHAQPKITRWQGVKAVWALPSTPECRPTLRQKVAYQVQEARAGGQLEHPKLGCIAFLSLYAPNTTREHTALWRELSSELSPSFKWVVMGDFNMYKSEADQKGGDQSVIEGRERLAWQHLKRRLHLEDTFCYCPGHLRFSWDNMKRGRHIPQTQEGNIGPRRLRRLARMYAHEQLMPAHLLSPPLFCLGSTWQIMPQFWPNLKS